MIEIEISFNQFLLFVVSVYAIQPDSRVFCIHEVPKWDVSKYLLLCYEFIPVNHGKKKQNLTKSTLMRNPYSNK